MERIRNILEIIYFISGPAIAIIAIYALKQISETKKQRDEIVKNRIINSKREAYKIAADKCDCYLTTIIPLMNKLDKSIEQSGIEFFKKSIVKFDNDKICVTPIFKNEEEKKILPSLKILDVLNPLEGFAVFFTSGVAEEKIAFLSVGRTYCTSVRFYLPYIVMVSKNKYFKNIIKLYKVWNNRFEVEDLKMQKEIINQKINASNTISIDTIGLN